MEVNTDSPYLPKSKVTAYLAFISRSLAYRIWQRLLNKYGGFEKTSTFNFLEVGCGPGYFLRCLENWFPQADLYGLDSEKALIDFSSGSLKRAKLLHNDGHTLPFQSGFFDVVGSLQVIEHLERPEVFLKEVNRVLKMNGVFLIATPNPKGLPARILGRKWQGIRYDHISLKAPIEWKYLFQQSGFSILKDGTTGLTGFKILQIFPFGLINWIPMAIWGWFPWYQGESYMSMMRKM